MGEDGFNEKAERPWNGAGFSMGSERKRQAATIQISNKVGYMAWDTKPFQAHGENGLRDSEH